MFYVSLSPSIEVIYNPYNYLYALFHPLGLISPFAISAVVFTVNGIISLKYEFTGRRVSLPFSLYLALLLTINNVSYAPNH